jgi:SAM-dependent methyltransferase
MDNYLDVNRAGWDSRAPAHAASPDYMMDRFAADPAFISDVVRFDLPRLGDVTGMRGVHLQCHIGTDTVSLARLGARMTGLDLSPASLAEARAFAERVGADVDFVEADVYSAPDVLPAGAFDLVFTGIGALCWLPDIRRWAGVVAHLLAPGGRLFLREGHPLLWALGELSGDDIPPLGYSYFEQPEPLVFTDSGTYVTTDVELGQWTSHEWNHGLGEIISALLDAGMQLTSLTEHDSVPWDALPGLMVKDDAGEYRLRQRPERLPASYTLTAVKR